MHVQLNLKSKKNQMLKPKMKSGRLEAFSDGVLAIIVTIMVLEIKVPHDAPTFADLKPLFPVFLSYILSFAMVFDKSSVD